MFQSVVEDLANASKHPVRGIMVGEPDGFDGRYHVVSGDAVEGYVV